MGFVKKLMLIIQEIYTTSVIEKSMLSFFSKNSLLTYALPYSSLKPYPLKPFKLPSKRLPFLPSQFSTALTSAMEAENSD